MADNKTKRSGAGVADYITSRASAQQRADCRALMAMLKKITKASPRMWGPSIVGYGHQRYAYESGRTGEAPLAAFAIRGKNLVVYVMVEGAKQKALLRRVGKHKMGKTCFYFRQLADLDQSVLEKLIVGSMVEAKQLHGYDGGA